MIRGIQGFSISFSEAESVRRQLQAQRNANNKLTNTTTTSSANIAASPWLSSRLNVADLLSRTLHRLRDNYIREQITSTKTTPGTPASTSGTIPSGSPTIYRALHQINTQTSTIRQSNSALALDVSTAQAASTLSATEEANTQTSTIRQSNSALGLDLTSQAASTIQSAAEINTATSTIRQSNSALGLDLTSQAASIIQSTAEINTAATSYGSVALTFSSGTSTGTLSGTYTGTGTAASATSLNMMITSNLANVSSSTPISITVEVRDQSNNLLTTVSNASYLAGNQLYLGADIGLSLSFGAGQVRKNATASTTVSNSTPTNVDAAATFNNANLNLRPRFENGAQVAAGSFTVNGTTVNVLAGDSINSVLSRINSTVSGITASFSGDRVTLSTTSASENDIVLAGDTSGFLNAVKLTSATTAKGDLHDDLELFKDSSRFGSVTTGSFSLNGTAISVNKDTDTLQSVISRVNASGAGVTASFDSVANNLVFTPDTAGATLSIDSDTSGFLAAADVDQGTMGTAVNAAAAFNGTGANGPLFDEGQSVVAGSFTVNGTTISVAADDTVNSVLSRINSTVSGITASFNGDRVILSTTSASENDIVLAGDTSGFLNAVKLTSAATAKGDLHDDLELFKDSSRFGSVTTGSFSLNGTAISVNKDTDTLQSVISRVNASGAGVTASFDAGANKLAFTPDTAGATLSIDSDTSGFLAAADVDQGTRGTAVNAAAAFNGTGASAPLFDEGQSVVAGSFTVNGTTISVAADDTVNSVVSRINSAVSGVSASFSGDRLNFATTGNSEQDIILANDTSGLLTALKVDGSTTVRGNIHDDLDIFADSSRFGSVTTGSFNLNGTSISVNKDTDNLQSVISRVNASGAGVTASFDSGANKLVFTPDTAGATLSIDSDTSGFLAAANVDQGTRGVAVNAAAAFNGTGINGPLFDPGISVTAGEFYINGTRIAVNADDSLNTLLSRITNSDANVTASFNSTIEIVSLTNKTSGTSPIILSGDTSGFLSAVKLDETAISIPGRSSGFSFDASLASQPVFSNVTDGTITINGQTINVTPSSSTLRGIISAIDNFSNVQATMDDTIGSITISSGTSNPVLEVSDTSNLLSALGISAGQYNGVTQTKTTVVSEGRRVIKDPGSIVSDIESALGAFNDVLLGANMNPSAEDAVRRILVRTFGSLEVAKDNGISMEQSNGNARIRIDSNKLTGALQNAPGTVEGFISSALNAASKLAPDTSTLQQDTAQMLGDLSLRASGSFVDLVEGLAQIQSPPYTAQALTAYGVDRDKLWNISRTSEANTSSPASANNTPVSPRALTAYGADYDKYGNNSDTSAATSRNAKINNSANTPVPLNSRRFYSSFADTKPTFALIS